MSKVVVTGGCGFIGSHVVDQLLTDGLDVTVVDNFSSGRSENLAHHARKKNLTLVEGDICDFELVKETCKDSMWIFHLAALADIVPSIKEPINYHNTNVNGAVSVLEAAKHAKVEKFLYAASSTCYGIPKIFPTPENAEIQPQYPYALTKTIGEQYAMHWHRVFDVPVNSLRMFNVYGKRSRTGGSYGAVFGVFLAQKLAGKDLTIVGDGKQTRDFTYVTDIVNAFVSLAKSNLVGQIMNVGSGQTHSINDIVRLLGGNPVYIPKRPGEPDITFADISKIRKLLNWEPKVPLEKGIGLMLDDINYWRDAPVWTPESIKLATKEWFDCLG